MNSLSQDRTRSDLGNKTKRGFSLIEALVAMLILAVVVLGGAAINQRSGVGILKQQDNRDALVAAQHIMEDYWNQSYASLQARAGGSDDTGNRLVHGKSMPFKVQFNSETPDDRGINYIQITVEIDPQTGADKIVLTTRRYELGISRAAL